jgi:hypothetical protein
LCQIFWDGLVLKYSEAWVERVPKDEGIDLRVFVVLKLSKGRGLPLLASHGPQMNPQVVGPPVQMMVVGKGNPKLRPKQAIEHEGYFELLHVPHN